jgi:hypothetical protein
MIQSQLPALDTSVPAGQPHNCNGCPPKPCCHTGLRRELIFWGQPTNKLAQKGGWRRIRWSNRLVPHMCQGGWVSLAWDEDTRSLGVDCEDFLWLRHWGLFGTVTMGADFVFPYCWCWSVDSVRDRTGLWIRPQGRRGSRQAPRTNAPRMTPLDGPMAWQDGWVRHFH